MMNQIFNPEKSQWEALLSRPVHSVDDLYGKVQHIIDEVRRKGDRAVKWYTREFDDVDLDNLENVELEAPVLRVTEKELAKAEVSIEPRLKEAIALARKNIERFHLPQLADELKVETMEGVTCWQRTVPIQSVGLYIPGGTAPLLSTVLMLGIPAALAGCKEVVLCSPPDREGNIHPAILYAAKLLGITKVFRVGGVQAIAAMAYGTETIPAVNKIFGPGNQYVTAAKQLVSRDRVAIDMPAGPSELAVMADETADPDYVASDLLSQAEHGSDSQVILVTTSKTLIKEVEQSLQDQLSQLTRKVIASKALDSSKIILLNSTNEMVEMINLYAPEHLIICCRDHRKVSSQITNAGSVFLGNFTPESAGDYASGTNHTLPTNGWARSYSGLNMDAFTKKITFQEITREGLAGLGEAVMEMAQAERLQAHRNAVEIRLKKDGRQPR